MSDSTLVKTAQISAILAASAASGGIISISIFTLPTLLLKPRQRKAFDRERVLAAPASHVARQWQYAYDIGKFVFPSTAVVSSLLFSYVAYAIRSDRNTRYLTGLYAAAAGLNLLIGPFTGLVISPVNDVIFSIAEKTDDLPAEGVTMTAEEKLQHEQNEHELVGSIKRLAQLNAVRSIFPLLAAGLGAVASFELI